MRQETLRGTDRTRSHATGEPVVHVAGERQGATVLTEPISHCDRRAAVGIG